MPIVWTRCPWLFGYLAAPSLYFLAETKLEQCHGWASPLVAETAAPAAVLAFCWHFHFLRRAAEVVFLNRYHGKGIPNERDSVLCFLYYSIWGAINGCTGVCLKQASTEVFSPIAVVGLALFSLGEVGNFLCHAYFRSLRKDPTDTKWTIPYSGPFLYLAAPHYTFELLAWIGYILAAGFSPPSIFIFVVSFVMLVQLSTARKEKYVKLYKDGAAPKGSPSPEKRWVLVPFIF